MNTKEELLHEMRSNESVLQKFSAEDIAGEWEQLRGPTRTAANSVAPTLDAITLSEMIPELGLMGRFVTMKVGEKIYVILKGSAGSRRILRGTRYLASNRKGVRFAVGSKGVLKSVKGGAVPTAVLFIGINTLESFLKDSVKLHTLLKTLSSDLIQTRISSLCAALAGLAAGAAAVVPTVADAPRHMTNRAIRRQVHGY